MIQVPQSRRGERDECGSFSSQTFQFVDGCLVVFGYTHVAAIFLEEGECTSPACPLIGWPRILVNEDECRLPWDHGSEPACRSVHFPTFFYQLPPLIHQVRGIC